MQSEQPAVHAVQRLAYTFAWLGRCIYVDNASEHKP